MANSAKDDFTGQAIFAGFRGESVATIERFCNDALQLAHTAANECNEEAANPYASRMIAVIMNEVASRSHEIHVGPNQLMALEKELVDMSKELTSGRPVQHLKASADFGVVAIGPTGPGETGHAENFHPNGPAGPSFETSQKRENETPVRVSSVAIEVLSAASGNDVGASRATIAKAVRENRSSIEVAAVALLAGINSRIREIEESGSNSGAVEDLSDLKNLRELVENFLKALSENAAEEQVAKAAHSVKGGFAQLWDENKDALFKSAYKTTLLGLGLTMFSQLGILTLPTTFLVSAYVDRESTVALIKAAGKALFNRTDT